MDDRQPTLFECGPVPTSQYGYPIDLNSEARKMTGRTDPETSMAAAKELVGSGRKKDQCDAVYGYLVQHPGLTSAELARASGMTGGARHLFARRLPDLMHETPSRARQGEKRLCAICNSVCVTWWPVEGDA